MGVDISVLFVPIRVNPSEILQAADQAFAEATTLNFVALHGDQKSGPSCVRQRFEQYSTVSLWGDQEEGLPEFARTLSQQWDVPLVALTACDHSCVGGWNIFRKGVETESYSTMGDGYTDCGVQAFLDAYAVTLEPSPLERLFFANAFLHKPEGLCVRSTSSALVSGNRVSELVVQQILEHDFAGVAFECLLMM
jgi:hypothetical protein